MPCTRKNHHIFSHYQEDDRDDDYRESYRTKCTHPGCFINEVRNPDGSVKIRNPQLANVKSDFLYHLGFGTDSEDLQKKFGDVKFVCMGGTPHRMKAFATYIAEQLGIKTGELEDLTGAALRYSMYKVGPVISVSHGMGLSSISILLHELIKLMAHAKTRNPVFFRLGTCGGLGLKPGTVVVTEFAVDGTLCSEYKRPILGKVVGVPAMMDLQFAQQLKQLKAPGDDFEVVTGGTMCASDFYEEQGRLDGAFCNFTPTDKMDYLKHLRSKGVVNIEMETVPLAALTFQAGIRASAVCVTLLDRLQGDQVLTPKAIMKDWETRPQLIVGRYIKEYLRKKPSSGNAGNACACSK